MKYYSLQRPVDIGTVPNSKENPIVNVFNYDCKTEVDDYPGKVWGYVEYDKPLTEEEMDDYELDIAGQRLWFPVVVRTDNETLKSKAHHGTPRLSIERPQEEERRGKKAIVTRMWFCSKEFADKFIEMI